MDVTIIRGAVMIGLIIGFVAVVLWAWSKKRKPDFERAARLPLEEDEQDERVDRRTENEE